MVAGAFKTMKHDHVFLEHPTGTQMNDRFEFQSPIGILGKIVDRLFLRALHGAIPGSPQWHFEEVG